MLLNYETNEAKLLQLVVLGQMELLPLLMNAQNLMHRVSLKYNLEPLNEEETKEMIKFRLRQAGYNRRQDLFIDESYKEILNFTKGFPRKIAMLCHKALKNLVMRNKPFVDKEIIREIIDSEVKLGWQKTTHP